MSRNVLIALVLIAMAVVVMILNTGEISLNLVIRPIRVAASLIYLAFTAFGVLIGVLLK